MDKEISTKKVFSGFAWRFAERFAAQGVSFVVSILLARMLGPEVYGTIALVSVFIVILQVFVDGGFANALVQKLDADELDFSSVFYFNMLVCLLLYALIFFAAPYIAGFYENPELTSVIRVMSLTLIVSGVKNVQQAYVSRNMLFKRFFFATLLGTVLSAVSGVYLAWRGYGVWALVFLHLINTVVDTILLWFTVKWRPKRMFSFSRLKSLMAFGWKLLVANLLNTVTDDIRQLIIGKLYSPESLGYYNKGKQLPNLFVYNVNKAIDSVLFPTMSRSQNDVDRVRDMTRRSMKVGLYVIAPIMVGCSACATHIIALLLTEKWLPAVPYLDIFCMYFMLQPVITANLNAIKGIGRSDAFLKLNVISNVVTIALVLVTMRIGIVAIALSLLASGVITMLINAWPNKKLINYSYADQLKDVLPTILLAALMGGTVYCVNFLGLGHVLTLLVQVPLGVIVYIALSILFKNDSFTYIINYAKTLKKRRSTAGAAVKAAQDAASWDQ